MEIPLLNDIEIILGLSVLVLFLFLRIRVPAIVGFLLTGVLAGPYGLRLVEAVHEVEILAEFGVVLLLFTIGLEFSFNRLLQIKKSVLLGGTLQVGLTILAVFSAYYGLGRSVSESVFMGFLFSLSSTAIVLKILQEGADVDSPHGRTALGILIFQDIVIVPMMLFTPLLAGAADDPVKSLLILGGKAAVIILLVIVSAKWVVPRLLLQIARTRSAELFLLSIVVLCLTVAWLTHRAGLSLSLGAFLAGLIISESEYSHEAFGKIIPFRDVFTSFFFVSIGMLLDIRVLFADPAFLGWMVLGIFSAKAFIVGITTLVLGYPLRTAILAGVALAQVGEFSFILSKSGIVHGLLKGPAYQQFLAVSVLTMAATPFLIALAPRLVDLCLRLPLPRRIKLGLYAQPSSAVTSVKDHLLIVGFGVNGRNLSRAARAANVPYMIVEMNPDTVRTEKTKGEPIIYGDATQEAVLQHVNIGAARIIVIAIPDASATRQIVNLARKLNPKVHIIARTRFFQEMQPLYGLGANEVIPEEFETSVEIFSRVLQKYLVPRDEIQKFIAEVRSDSYEIFRSIHEEPTAFCDLKLHMPDEEITALRVHQGAPADGKTLVELNLRKDYGVSVLAIRRDRDTLSNPDGDTPIHAGDVIVVLGTPERIAKMLSLIHLRQQEVSV